MPSYLESYKRPSIPLWTPSLLRLALDSLRQYQGHDLAECQREGTVLRDDLVPAVQGSVRQFVSLHFMVQALLQNELSVEEKGRSPKKTLTSG